MTNQISSGTVHEIPAALKKALNATPASLARWESLTPLARNEWICWVTSSKKKRRGLIMSTARSKSYDKACADRVAGWAAFIVRIKR